jgi:HSP20 family protein
MPRRPILHRRESGILPAWPEFDRLEQQMQQLLRGIPLSEGEAQGLVWAPRVDFAEEEERYVLSAELPGIDPEDVEVQVEGNVLSIRGEKKLERETENERVRISERRYGAFERAFTLPTNADPDKITADVRRGVLHLEIEKRPETRGRKIEVQAG